MKKLTKRNVSGFTLIELLVVVLIIGILSAIALPQYEKSVEKARLAEAFLQINAMEKAMNIYMMENGGLPTTGTVSFTKTNPDVVSGIDVRSGLSCDATGYCSSKYFLYRAECSSQACSWWVERLPRGKRYDMSASAGTAQNWAPRLALAYNESDYKLLRYLEDDDDWALAY